MGYPRYPRYNSGGNMRLYGERVEPLMFNDEYFPQRRLNRKKSALLWASLILIILVMAVLTWYFLPKTYGEIVDDKEVYLANGPFTIMVELGLDEYWHVKSWTDTPGTGFNVTLIGYPIVEGTEMEIAENDFFAYTWTLNLDSSGTYELNEFDLKIPRSSSKWIFNIFIEGHGSIHLLITKFDRYSFYMFFIPDMIGSIVIVIIIILILKQKKSYEMNTYSLIDMQ